MAITEKIRAVEKNRIMYRFTVQHSNSTEKNWIYLGSLYRECIWEKSLIDVEIALFGEFGILSLPLFKTISDEKWSSARLVKRNFSA